MGGMPFYLEKGMTLEVIESFANSGADNLVGVLRNLREHGTILPWGIGSTSLDIPGVPAMKDVAARFGHLERDWFGRTTSTSGSKKNPRPDQPVLGSDGDYLWWHRYAGDVEEIMVQTMILAAEVALGLPRGSTDYEAARSKPWPIELFWKCGQNWFEGWVTWRGQRDAEPNGTPANVGQVTVILATPSAGSPVRQSPLAAPAPHPSRHPEYTETPEPRDDRGMVVVTHSRHNLVTDAIGFPDETATGAAPAPRRRYWVGSGPIVSVAPSSPDGGVTQNSWTYEEPTP